MKIVSVVLRTTFIFSVLRLYAMRLSGFPPAGSRHAHILILGTMPGAASLRAGEYYAHPRNQFWPIMGALTGAGPHLPYEQRLNRLADFHIALWNVIQSCSRHGSLDSNMEDCTLHDFRAFFSEQTAIHHIFFNGAQPRQIFEKQVLPLLRETSFTLTVLPSTSPAHARLNFQQKLAAWRQIPSVFRE